MFVERVELDFVANVYWIQDFVSRRSRWQSTAAAAAMRGLVWRSLACNQRKHEQHRPWVSGQPGLTDRQTDRKQYTRPTSIRIRALTTSHWRDFNKLPDCVVVSRLIDGHIGRGSRDGQTVSQRSANVRHQDAAQHVDRRWDTRRLISASCRRPTSMMPDGKPEILTSIARASLYVNTTAVGK